ncbi:hypothetical protein [Streptomyces puniciscabiei]|uniref:hypothetical protein n=1 Tax=Streptomyces puniciscabiei TaxID=164348 RepID=UPI0033209742
MVDAHAPADDPLVLVVSSVGVPRSSEAESGGGRTVADLVRHYGSRVAPGGLGSPAVYAPEAWEVPFGNGRGRFSGVIRLELPGAEHRLGLWFRDQAEDRREFVTLRLSGPRTRSVAGRRRGEAVAPGTGPGCQRL